MKNNPPPQKKILIKFLLVGAEIVFVGILCYMRVLNMGWLLFIYGILLILWMLIHLGLMTSFIVTLRLSAMDIALYVAVHFFYLWAWLFQSDGGDSGDTGWTIQTIHYIAVLDPFLKKWGDPLFWIMSSATFICYLIITILLCIRLVQFLRSRNKNAQPA
jgi:hypothetical protein